MYTVVTAYRGSSLDNQQEAYRHVTKYTVMYTVGTAYRGLSLDSQQEEAYRQTSRYS
jgi:hypothetical protein